MENEPVKVFACFHVEPGEGTLRPDLVVYRVIRCGLSATMESDPRTNRAVAQWDIVASVVPNWNETRRRLARRCKERLEANLLHPETPAGREYIHAFYSGALCALNREAHQWVTACLLSGDYKELLKED